MKSFRAFFILCMPSILVVVIFYLRHLPYPLPIHVVLDPFDSIRCTSNAIQSHPRPSPALYRCGLVHLSVHQLYSNVRSHWGLRERERERERGPRGWCKRTAAPSCWCSFRGRAAALPRAGPGRSREEGRAIPANIIKKAMQTIMGLCHPRRTSS